MTTILIGLAILWGVPIVVSVAVVLRVIREERAERREMAECRCIPLTSGAHAPACPMAEPLDAIDAQRFNSRTHGRADHLRN